MLSKLAVKSHGILLELSLWTLLAIGATGGFGICAALGQWTVGVPAGGAQSALFGPVVSFIGAVLFVAPVLFIRDIRQSIGALEEAGRCGNAA
ncbi:MAG: hypothetical protein F4186_05835 [Boseongicola sp. SB0676_bin_33]|uniref:Uncharacterized protein n=1 Tax=Boseongicola sp. SB0664_bin_43 TaxID=2604844 RepID=A0A6B0Y0T2_9RHOB|nr:hypothetical protein [Boseongicola sp. SB0664_bin_43]MYF88904.1 hypothetical protein [Boseongicola sp. SB0676_bin_33]